MKRNPSPNKVLYILMISILLFHGKINAQIFGKGKKNSEQTEVKYTPKFSYEPESRTPVANTGITIALITPYFAGRNTDDFAAPLKDFRMNMQNEIEVLLIAKGYKVLGPFKTKDEMVFSDKQKADFTLLIEIPWEGTFTREITSIKGPGGFKDKKGTINITRGLNITAISNFSGEKLWKKHLSLDAQYFTWTGSVDLGRDKDVPFWTEYEKDPNLSNPLAKNLEDTYQECMKFLWNQFDLDEIKNIVEEAKKERSPDKQKKE